MSNNDSWASRFIADHPEEVAAARVRQARAARLWRNRVIHRVHAFMHRQLHKEFCSTCLKSAA